MHYTIKRVKSDLDGKFLRASNDSAGDFSSVGDQDFINPLFAQKSLRNSPHDLSLNSENPF